MRQAKYHCLCLAEKAHRDIFVKAIARLFKVYFYKLCSLHNFFLLEYLYRCVHRKMREQNTDNIMMICSVKAVRKKKSNLFIFMYSMNYNLRYQ